MYHMYDVLIKILGKYDIDFKILCNQITVLQQLFQYFSVILFKEITHFLIFMIHLDFLVQLNKTN